MRIAILSEDVSDLPKPTMIEIIGLANLGYRSLVDVHLVDEAIDPAGWLQLKAAANAWRMEAAQLEITSISLQEEDIAAVRKALERLPGPIAAFCRADVRRGLFKAFAIQNNSKLEQEAVGAANDDHGLELLRLC